ncbi:MAG TPA: ABC transporter permease [Anaerolineae bacterium]|nr:ABC transporter permease [Anaerolineae bacterium]
MDNVLTSLLSALRQRSVWLWFGRQDIRSRYRGSLLGPLWLVLNLGILVATLSLIYATIFDLDLTIYVPHVAVGFIAWWFVSGVLTESCTAFTANAQIIRNVPLPLGIYVLRVLARQSLLMAHNFIVYLVVAVAFSVWPTVDTLLVVPGFLLVSALLFTIGMSLAIICARYRDVPHIVASVVQIVIFVTPILFLKEMLERKTIIADANPFYHMIEAIRAPLLGQAPEGLTWIFLVVANLISAIFALWLLRRAGHRVPYLV